MIYPLGVLAIAAVKAAADVVKDNKSAINEFLRNNKATINCAVKMSGKQVAKEAGEKVDNMINKYKKDGWNKKK